MPDVPPWDFGVLLAKERETLGFYLSDHPLRKFELEYNSFATVHLGEPDTFGNKEFVVAVGVVTEMRTKIDRSGRTMAFFKLDDLTGSCECLMFSKNYEEYGTCIKTESTVMVKGRVESSGDAIKLHVEESYPLEEVREKFTTKLLLLTDEKKHDSETIQKIKVILDEHMGDTPVYLSVRMNGGKRDFYLDQKIKLETEAIKKLTNLLGENGLRYLT